MGLGPVDASRVVCLGRSLRTLELPGYLYRAVRPLRASLPAVRGEVPPVNVFRRWIVEQQRRGIWQTNCVYTSEEADEPTPEVALEHVRSLRVDGEHPVRLRVETLASEEVEVP